MTSRIDRRHNLSDSYKMAALAMGPELRLGGTLSLEIVPAGSQCILEHDQVELKRKYNDQHSKTRGLLPGSQWYEIQAYRALNQALGRCIRHKNDWGALILVDDRFRSNPNKYITEMPTKKQKRLQQRRRRYQHFFSIMNITEKCTKNLFGMVPSAPPFTSTLHSPPPPLTSASTGEPPLTSVSTGLSKWVRQQVQHHATFSNALVSLVGFAKKHQDAIDSPHHSHSQAPHGQSNVHELTANPSLLDLTVHPPLKDVVETGRGITFHDNYPLCSARVSTVPAPASSHSSQSFIKAKTGDQVLEAESRGCLSVENENFGSVKLRSDIARTEKKKWKSWNTPESMGSFFNCKPITSTPMPGSSKTCTTPVIDLCQENLESESYQPTFSICRRPSQSVYLKPNSSPLSSSRLKTDATIVVEPLDTWDGGNEDLCSDRIPVLDIDLSPVKEEGNVSVLPLPVVDNGDESMYFTPPLYDEGYCVESDYPGDGLLAPSVTTVAEHKTNVNAERFSVSVDKLFEISSPRSDSLGIDVITHTASCTASRDRVTHHQQGLGNAVIATTDVVNVEKLEPTNLEHTPIRKNRLSRSRNRGVSSSFNSKSFS